MKIVDCFIFYNEIDLLNYRLNLLYDIVDYFIIVEATKTHMGNPKKMYFEENKESFLHLKKKIIHIIIDLPYDNPKNTHLGHHPDAEQWQNEIFQRNSISLGIDKLNLDDDDLIMISDIDEIINPNILINLSKENIGNKMIRLEQIYYIYNLNHIVKYCDKKNNILFMWYGTKILLYKTYKEQKLSIQQIRMNVENNILPNGGWHLSNFGDETFIYNKYKNYSHQEFNNNSLTVDDVKKNMNKIDENTIFIPIKDNKNLPPLYYLYLQKFIKE